MELSIEEDKSIKLVEVPCLDLRPMGEVTVAIKLSLDSVRKMYSITDVISLTDIESDGKYVYSFVYNGIGNIWTEDGQWTTYDVE